MQRTRHKFFAATPLAALSAAVACIGACGDDEIVLGLPMGGTVGYGPVGGAFGTGGSDDNGGSGGLGGSGAGPGGSGGRQSSVDGGTSGPGGSGSDASDGGCSVASDCNDGNDCTTDACQPGGGCMASPSGAGSPCGESATTACSAPDTCDGAGACLPNHGVVGAACGSSNTDDVCTDPDTCDGAGTCAVNHAANATACASGRCTAGVCDCAHDRVTAAPFTRAWNTATGALDLFGGTCGSAGDPDYVVVFTAPSAGTYRFSASGSPDSTIGVAEGDCGTQQLVCDDDIAPPAPDSQLDVPLTAAQVVTFFVTEFDSEDGGSGTLGIQRLP